MKPKCRSETVDSPSREPGWRAALSDEAWVEWGALDDDAWYARVKAEFGIDARPEAG